MITRKRNYALNPRSPPKRRRRSTRKTREVPRLGLSNQYNLRTAFSSTAETPQQYTLTSTETISSPPDLIHLPPIPDSPILPESKPLTSDLDLYADSSVELPASKLKSLSTKSTNTLLDLIEDLKKLNLNDHTFVSSIPPLRFSYPAPLPETPFYRPMTAFHSSISQSSNMSFSMTPDQFALHEIDHASKNLGNHTKFPCLEKDGSNFIEWKKNTGRAMKAMLRIPNFWDSSQPLSS